MASLTLTLIGRDRPGLVEVLAARIAAAGGNWLEARMARLAGQFAGILLVEVADAEVERLVATLHGLEADGIRVTVEQDRGAVPVPTRRLLTLELVGQDRPGIVRDIARVLAGRRVNIEELTTEVVSGSFSGESLFRATARLQRPDDLAIDELRDALEALAHELMVDIELEEAASSRGPRDASARRT